MLTRRPVLVALTAAAFAIAIFGCKKEKAEPVLDAPLVVVSAPPPNVVAPPVATFNQAQGNPDATPAPAMPVQSAGAGSTGAPRGPSTLDRAIEASKDGRSADVRRLLESKVRSGHASADEVRLVREACKRPYDRVCLDDIKAKYP